MISFSVLRNSLAAVLLLTFTALIAGCGAWGSSSNGISQTSSGAPPTAQLTAIAIEPQGASYPSGLTHQFTATGTYSDGSTQDISSAVTWSSSQPTVASISNRLGSIGVATTVAAGSATITAASGGVLASTTLTVTTATLVSISVTPPNASIANGTSQQFIATGLYDDNSTQNLTTSAIWTSSNTAVAFLGTTSTTLGLATAVAVGQTTITATLGGIAGSTTLTVTPATLVSITVTPANPNVAKGSPEPFKATGTYTDESMQDLTATVTWSSSNAAVATITNAGVATALAIGQATITATLGGVTGSTTLTVTAITLVSIAVTPANPGTPLGTKEQFTATGTYSDGSTQILTTSVTWSSNTPAVATISNVAANGLATTLTVGTTTITATLGFIAGSTVLTVTPAALMSIAVTPANSTIGIPASEPFTAIGTYTDGTQQRITTTVTWSSSTLGVATISNAAGSQGIATAAAAGTTQITAAMGMAITSAPVTLTVTAAAEYAYATDFGAGGVPVPGFISQYTIGAGGALTPINPPTAVAATGPFAVTVSPSGKYAYVADYGSGNGTAAFVSQYTIGAGGALTAMVPATVAAGFGAQSVVVHPSGLFAYTANYWAGSVSQYSVGGTGALAAMAPASVLAGAGAASVTVDPTGRYAYVANYGTAPGSVSQYTIGMNGALTAMTPETVVAGTNPNSVVVDPTGRFAYVANEGGTPGSVSQYTIGAGGALTAMTPATVAAGADPSCVTVDPTGRYAYVTNYGNNGAGTTVSQYAIGPNGALTPLTVPTVTAGTGPTSVSVEPTGHYAYVSNRSSGDISQFMIGADGSLTLMTTSAAGTEPTSLIAAY